MKKEAIDSAFGKTGVSISSLYMYLLTPTSSTILTGMRRPASMLPSAIIASAAKWPSLCASPAPGATNFVSGLYTCNIVGIPLPVITGQAVISQLDQGAFQCIDIAKTCAWRVRASRGRFWLILLLTSKTAKLSLI
ncbi:MAG: thiamine pyrophosphate-binding protein [Christensenellales bacterium]